LDAGCSWGGHGLYILDVVNTGAPDVVMALTH
jgi:hypothetical protein